MTFSSSGPGYVSSSAGASSSVSRGSAVIQKTYSYTNVAPLELLPYLSGIINTPRQELVARGTQNLDVRQRAVGIGEPIPIVFARRVNNNGGVFISPGATEARFENNNNNDLSVYYQLVVSEGELPAIPLNDLYQGACKIGVYIQNYNARADTWLPGNFVTLPSSLVDLVQFSFDAPGTASPTWYNATKNQYGGWDFIYNGQPHYYPGTGSPGPAGPVLQTRLVTAEPFELQKLPFHCGTSGHYTNMTTLSYSWAFPNGNDKWDRQIHCFIRNGMQVTRILDSVYGPSNNVVDLVKYLVTESSRLPLELLDNTALLEAANFTNTNSFFYNGEFKESTNLEDWLQDIAPKFLLRLSEKNGKKGLRPLVPINDDYTIKTTAVTWDFTFTEEHVLPNGFEIDYIELSERKPITALIIWRQQPDNDIGIVRTAEVRIDNEAENGPYEQHDLSQFCTTENHAVKFGAFLVARRKYVTHSVRLRVKPDSFNSTLTLGDLVRVRLLRETQTGVVSWHDYLYEVQRVDKAISGVVELDLLHFPIDSQNCSLVAKMVAAATGAGDLLPSGRTDFSCNQNTSSEPIDTGGGNLPNLPDFSSTGTSIPTPSAPNDEESPPQSDIPNPPDPIAQPVPTPLGSAVEDSTVTVPAPPCPNATVIWYRIPKTPETWDPKTGEIKDYTQAVEVSRGPHDGGYGSLAITTDDIDYIIYAEYICPGSDEPIPAAYTEPVKPDIDSYTSWQWIGAIYTQDGQQNPVTKSGSWSPGDTAPRVAGVGGTNTGHPIALTGSLWGTPRASGPWAASATGGFTHDASSSGGAAILGGTAFCPGAMDIPAHTFTGGDPNTTQYAQISGYFILSKPGKTTKPWYGQDVEVENLSQPI